jgi:integrase
MAIKERLGHSSITTTLDRYGHLFPALDKAIAEGLDGLLRASLDAPADIGSQVLGLGG